MSDDLVKRLRDLGDRAEYMPHMHHVAADRIEELEAENQLLNDQMAVLEEWGREDLNALPDCLMRLAPALVEIDELKAKLAKAVEALEFYANTENWISVHNHEDAKVDVDEGDKARTTLAEIRGE